MKPLTIDQAMALFDKFTTRRYNFPAEDAQTAFVVVLLNYGDHLTPVACVAGEWTGTKGEARSQYPPHIDGGGLPLCPNGHVLTEGATRQRLGLIEEELL